MGEAKFIMLAVGNNDKPSMKCNICNFEVRDKDGAKLWDGIIEHYQDVHEKEWAFIELNDDYLTPMYFMEHDKVEDKSFRLFQTKEGDWVD